MVLFGKVSQFQRNETKIKKTHKAEKQRGNISEMNKKGEL